MNFFCLQARAQGARVNEIVFNRITRPEHPCPGKTGNGVEEFLLDLLRQGGRDAVWINGAVVQSLRFEENLMRLALLEPHHLVFDRGAIAGPPAGNRAGIDRRCAEIFFDNCMALWSRVGDEAVDLRAEDRLGQKGKGLGFGIAALAFEHVPIDRAAIEPWRSSGFETAKAKT